MVARTVEGLNCNQRPYKVMLDDGQEIPTRSIVLAIGAQYNKPSLSNLESFVGRGVYYNATFMEAQLCADEDIVVIGGGNSAGQAAVFLSQNTEGIQMLVRSKSLTETMSRYLIQRIEENPSIQVHYSNELTRLAGAEHLEQVSWIDKNSHTISTRPIRHVFVDDRRITENGVTRRMCLARQQRFVLTGRDLGTMRPPISWPLSRPPRMLEQTFPESSLSETLDREM
jgi:thioredoxin reductase (NADPH)